MWREMEKPLSTGRYITLQTITIFRISCESPRFSILKTELAHCQTRNTVTLAHWQDRPSVASVTVGKLASVASRFSVLVPESPKLESVGEWRLLLQIALSECRLADAAKYYLKSAERHCLHCLPWQAMWVGHSDRRLWDLAHNRVTTTYRTDCLLHRCFL